MSTKQDAEKKNSVGRPPKEKPNFERRRAITLPTYSIKDWPQGKSLFVRIDGDINTREQTDEDGTVKMERGKPLLLHSVAITDLETGEQGSMVIPFVIKKAFDAILEKGETLQGKAFELIKGRKVNRTNEYSVYELEL